jgi:hypothetical protein
MFYQRKEGDGYSCTGMGAFLRWRNVMRARVRSYGDISIATRSPSKEKPLGNDLLSQEVALQVPSALTCLTSGFGMGPGVPTSLKSPRDNFTKLSLNSS